MSDTGDLESALQHHEQGDLVGAERFYRAALEAEPNNIAATHSAGVLALQAGDFPLASARLRRALELGVTLPGTHLLLGRALKGQGDIDGAIASYRRALEADRDMVDAYISLGLALKDQGRLDEAVASYRSALAVDPDSFEARLNLGNALQLRSRLDEALAEFEQAAVLRPDSPHVHYNLGRVLRAQRRDTEAVERFQQAIVLDQGFLDAYFNLGNALASIGQYAAAVDCFLHLQELLATGAGRPVEPATRARLSRDTQTALAAPLVWSARFDEAEPLLAEALAREPDSVILHEYRLVALPYRCTRQDELLDLYRQYQRLTPMRLEPPLVTAPRMTIPDRLRIGYISGDLRDHSMAFFLEPLLANHDRSAFQVLCYSTNLRDDEVTLRLKACADGWFEARDIEDEALVQRIRDDGVDILVDLSGRTVRNRLGVFARRPAWLQLAYLGYPTYTGVPQIAYRMTDAVIDPEGMRGLESERPLRLPRSMFCYRPPADAPECARITARERGYLCFGSFNQLQKLSPEILAAWARILADTPGSRLLLKTAAFNDPRARGRMIESFERMGVESERVMIRGGTAGRHEHLALYNEIDIALDTYPYNGATTTCEASWMGVPVITLAGETHASRMGASILTALDLTELVTHSVDDYVAAACRLARARASLVELHAGLRRRFIDSPLRDESGFTRSFEQTLRSAWHTSAQVRS